MSDRGPNESSGKSVPSAKVEASSLPKILSNSAIILAVITAVLYFHGRSLYEGYYSYWGLSTELFPITTESAIFHAGWFYLTFGIAKWWYLAVMIGYVLFVFLVVFFLLSERPFRLIQKAAKTNVINSHQKSVFGEMMGIGGRFSQAALVVLTFVLLSIFAFQKGKSMAESQHQTMLAGQPISKNKFRKVSLTFLDETGHGKHLSGYRLATSSSFYALFTDKSVRVLPLSRITSMEMVATEKTAKKPSE